MSGALQTILGPGLVTWILLSGGTVGWIALGLGLVLAAAALGPVAGWTVRVLDRHRVQLAASPGPVPVPAGARQQNG